MSSRPRVFVSAVSKELHSARQLVANTLTFLGYEPVWQDIFGSEQGDLREMLRRKIDTCEGLIQLAGQRFGFGPTNPESDEHAVSYTQFELHHARERGIKVWPIILADQYPPDVPNDEPETYRQNQNRYRESLAPSAKDNKSPVPLYQPAANSIELENITLKLRQPLEELRGEWKLEQRRVHRFRLLVATGLSLLVILVIAALWLGWRTKNDTAQLKTILDEYVQRSTVDAPAGQRGYDATREHALMAELDKKYGLPSGTLTNELPAFAKKLADDGTATLYERAQGAFVAKDYSEAERFALMASAEAQKAVPVDKGKIIKALELAGWCAIELREDAKALTNFTTAASLADKVSDPLQWARIHHGLAYALKNRGHYSQAESILRQVVLVYAEALGPEHPITLNMRSNLAAALSALGRFDEAKAENQAVRQIRERTLGPEHPDTLRSRNNLIAALVAEGNYAEAETECRAVIKLSERNLGPEHPDTLTVRNNLAAVLGAQSKFAEAEKELRAVVLIYERIRGSEHPDTLKSKCDLTVALANLGKFEESEAGIREVIALQERVCGSNHPDTVRSLYNLARCLDKQDKLKEAVEVARRAVQGQQQLFDFSHPDTIEYQNFCDSVSARIHNNEGAALFVQGKYAEAEMECRAALSIRQRIDGPKHSETLKVRNNLALALGAQGKHAEAGAEHRAVLQIREDVLGVNHPDTLNSLNNLALCLEQQGEPAEAREFARRAAEGAQKVLPLDDLRRRTYQSLYERLAP